MLFYLHGGDLELWLILLLLFMALFVPLGILCLPFLFFYGFQKEKKLPENTNEDKKYSSNTN